MPALGRRLSTSSTWPTNGRRVVLESHGTYRKWRGWPTWLRGDLHQARPHETPGHACCLHQCWRFLEDPATPSLCVRMHAHRQGCRMRLQECLRTSFLFFVSSVSWATKVCVQVGPYSVTRTLGTPALGVLQSSRCSTVTSDEPTPPRVAT